MTYRFAPGLLLALSGTIAHADERPLQATTHEPRAFGYQVGDPAERRVTIHAPAGLQLDPASLPRPRTPGQPLELRTIAWQRFTEGGGASRYELRLGYQVFVAPPEVRTFELPPLSLRFDGTPRPQDLRIDAWPITVAPLVPVEVSPRRGLGELQDDAPPPLIDSAAVRGRLLACAAAIALLLVYLGGVYLGLPRWRRPRPFARAWRDLRGLPAAPDAAQYRMACRRLHAALNGAAGEVLFEHGLDAFIARQPRFAALREALGQFFRRSRLAFFDAASDVPNDGRWLVDLCRRCRDIERGSG